MKIPEMSNEGRLTASDDDAKETQWPVPPAAIAPWWHAAILIALILGVSLLSGLESKTKGFGSGHMGRYAETIVWEWLLGAFAWWGLRMRGVRLRQVLGEGRKGTKTWLNDMGAALLFWIMAMIVLAAIATVLRLLHWLPAPKAVLELAPQGALELLMWTILCITAGIVEEFVFRGYLLQQFASIRGTLWLGIVLSSLLFGAGHGYEGIGGVIAITAYGAMFALFALQRKSLRACMMAHAWHDAITGIALAILKRMHAI